MGLILTVCEMLQIWCRFTPDSKLDPRPCHAKETAVLHCIIPFFPSTKRPSPTRGTELYYSEMR